MRFGYMLFKCKGNGGKAAFRMLVKLTTAFLFVSGTVSYDLQMTMTNVHTKKRTPNKPSLNFPILFSVIFTSVKKITFVNSTFTFG
jgi:hypothetical protein